MKTPILYIVAASVFTACFFSQSNVAALIRPLLAGVAVFSSLMALCGALILCTEALAEELKRKECVKEVGDSKDSEKDD